MNKLRCMNKFVEELISWDKERDAEMEELESTLKGFKEIIDATEEGKRMAETVAATVARLIDEITSQGKRRKMLQSFSRLGRDRDRRH